MQPLSSCTFTPNGLPSVNIDVTFWILAHLCPENSSFLLKTLVSKQNYSTQGRPRSPHKKHLSSLTYYIFPYTMKISYKQRCISVLNVKSGGKTEDVHGITIDFITVSVVCPVSMVSSLSHFVQHITNHPAETYRTRLVPFAPQNILDIL